MWPFKQKHKMFHEKYPEILQWQKGDIIKVNYGGCHPIPPTYFGGIYQGVCESEKKYYIVILKLKDGSLSRDHFYACVNQSLRDRHLQMQLKGTYNQYLRDIQEAIKQLSS